MCENVNTILLIWDRNFHTYVFLNFPIKINKLTFVYLEKVSSFRTYLFISKWSDLKLQTKLVLVTSSMHLKNTMYNSQNKQKQN